MLTIPHKPEAIPAPILNVEVFRPQLLNHLSIQQCASRPRGRHLWKRLAHLKQPNTLKRRWKKGSKPGKLTLPSFRWFLYQLLQPPLHVKVLWISSPYLTNSSVAVCFGTTLLISSLAIFRNHLIIQSALQLMLVISVPCPTVAFGPVKIK